MILPTSFDHLEESFSYKDVQFKKFCLPMKQGRWCPPTEHASETPVLYARFEDFRTFLNVFMSIVK